MDELKLVSLFDCVVGDLLSFPIFDIWADPEHSAYAKEGALEWLLSDRLDGHVYMIMHGTKLLGITGWYNLGTIDGESCVGMRWHGILPPYRGIGYSRRSIDLLVQQLPKEAKRLYNNTNSVLSKEHFLKCGFYVVEDKHTQTVVSDLSGYDTSEGWALERRVWR